MIDIDRPPTRMRSKEAAEYLKKQHGISRTPGTLAKLRCTGGGPLFEKDGRLPLYTPASLDQYAKQMLANHALNLRMANDAASGELYSASRQIHLSASLRTTNQTQQTRRTPAEASPRIASTVGKGIENPERKSHEAVLRISSVRLTRLREAARKAPHHRPNRRNPADVEAHRPASHRIREA